MSGYGSITETNEQKSDGQILHILKWAGIVVFSIIMLMVFLYYVNDNKLYYIGVIFAEIFIIVSSVKVGLNFREAFPV